MNRRTQASYVTAYEERPLDEGAQRVLAWAGVEKPYWVSLVENITAGAGFSGILYLAVMPDTWFAFKYGAIMACSLCVFRFTIDEMVAFFGAIADRCTIAYANTRNEYDAIEARRDAMELARACYEMEQQIAALRGRLPKGKGSKIAQVNADPVPVHPDIEWVDTLGGDVAATLAEPTGPDEDTIYEINCAVELLNHYAAEGKLSKHSAEGAGIKRKAWQTAIDFLIACGAVARDGQRYTLTVDNVEEADRLIDQFVEGRAQATRKAPTFVPA